MTYRKGFSFKRVESHFYVNRNRFMIGNKSDKSLNVYKTVT
jgi:hypothetical protein